MANTLNVRQIARELEKLAAHFFENLIWAVLAMAATVCYLVAGEMVVTFDNDEFLFALAISLTSYLVVLGAVYLMMSGPWWLRLSMIIGATFAIFSLLPM